MRRGALIPNLTIMFLILIFVATALPKLLGIINGFAFFDDVAVEILFKLFVFGVLVVAIGGILLYMLGFFPTLGTSKQ